MILKDRNLRELKWKLHVLHQLATKKMCLVDLNFERKPILFELRCWWICIRFSRDFLSYRTFFESTFTSNYKATSSRFMVHPQAFLSLYKTNYFKPSLYCWLWINDWELTSADSILVDAWKPVKSEALGSGCWVKAGLKQCRQFGVGTSQATDFVQM